MHQLIRLQPATGGARKPAEFLCLILKLLQIQPDKEIIIEYIKNEDYKYVRILGERHLSDLRIQMVDTRRCRAMQNIDQPLGVVRIVVRVRFHDMEVIQAIMKRLQSDGADD